MGTYAIIGCHSLLVMFQIKGIDVEGVDQIVGVLQPNEIRKIIA